MYVTRVEIRNIRSIQHLVWEIEPENAAGWHVILGDNGSGKSTFVRAVALCLIGGNKIPFLNRDLNNWERKDSSDNAYINTTIKLNLEFDWADSIFDSDDITNDLKEALSNGRLLELSLKLLPSYRVLKGGLIRDVSFFTDNPGFTDRYAFNSKFFNGFSSSYGPFRRFSGGDKEEDSLIHTSQYPGRHISAFSEGVTLIEGIRWLQSLQFKQLEKDESAKQILASINSFVNQTGFLPYNVRLNEITSSGVKFSDGSGTEVAVEELSDGYRSILSMTFELLRQLSISYGADLFEQQADRFVVKVPGVVQIDEVDAHLHPTWQRRIGFWLREHFPNIQFIVTTHSPLICQAAEKGSIYRLPTPGTDETGQMLTGTDRDRLLYGNILEAYSTEAFGNGITRSEQSQAMLESLGALNIKEITEGLSDAERAEQNRLRAILPTTATTLPIGTDG